MSMPSTDLSSALVLGRDGSWDMSAGSGKQPHLSHLCHVYDVSMHQICLVDDDQKNLNLARKSGASAAYCPPRMSVSRLAVSDEKAGAALLADLATLVMPTTGADYTPYKSPRSSPRLSPQLKASAPASSSVTTLPGSPEPATLKHDDMPGSAEAPSPMSPKPHWRSAPFSPKLGSPQARPRSSSIQLVPELNVSLLTEFENALGRSPRSSPRDSPRSPSTVLSYIQGNDEDPIEIEHKKAERRIQELHNEQEAADQASKKTCRVKFVVDRESDGDTRLVDLETSFAQMS